MYFRARILVPFPLVFHITYIMLFLQVLLPAMGNFWSYFKKLEKSQFYTESFSPLILLYLYICTVTHSFTKARQKVEVTRKTKEILYLLERILFLTVASFFLFPYCFLFISRIFNNATSQLSFYYYSSYQECELKGDRKFSDS